MTATLGLPIHVRAYVPDGSRPKTGRGHAPQASQWSIVFDCETTVDAAQQLRFGTYQLRKGGTIREQGYFYDENALSREEMAILWATAAKQGVKAVSKDAFVETVLYRIGYHLRALIIGFNLPFDLSRLAIDHSRAKKGMTGGFTFQLSQNPKLARIQIRHLSRRAAFIQFAGIGRQRLARSERKRGVSRESRRGHFLYLNTLASALFSKSFNLASLCDHLSTKTRKLSTGEHGRKLTPDYLRYAMTDTQATWECYVELARHFEENFGLKDLALESIYSEASLGKAFLKAMKIKPWRVCQPGFPDEITGQILSAYYGGRSEVKIRRDIRQVLYCDFLSMYPTVCSLMGLWRFVIADGVTWRDATHETRALLASIGPDDLQNPDMWKRLRVLVQVQADNDLFPVRAAYGDGPQTTIGLNRLTSDAPLWFTLADCIASAILSGKPPNIIRAIEFLPGEPQTGLRPVTLPGGARIDPEHEDFYRAIIDRRQQIKAQLKDLSGTARGELDIAQNSLKIIANATSYGSFVEINVQDLTRERDGLCHGPADAPFPLRVTKDEQPGIYFHPLLATVITGAARLMLALTERQIIDAGLDWVLCDTDSMAMARPDGMSAADFYTRAKSICGWFEPLNPYQVKGPVLKIETANYALDGTGRFEPLYALAVSAKRYALFNLAGKNRPIIRKASAHGLGHFRAPYPEDGAPKAIPSPAISLDEIGVSRWQHDIWYQIISAALSDRPEQVDLGFHDAMNGPAIARFGVTTPALLDWFKAYNRGKPHARRVKPFNFLASLVANRFAMQEPEFAGARRPRKTPPCLRPIAPFDTDPDVVASRAFDRITGEPIPREALKTYSQSLAQYHLHPEDKFEGGDFGDRGETTRRHVRAAAIIHIGKEANRWEEQEALGFDPDQHPDYGLSPDDIARIRAGILEAIERTSVAAVAKATDLSSRKLKSIIADGTGPREWLALFMAAEKAVADMVEVETAREIRGQKLSRMVRRFGLSRVARRIGMDKSNLRRLLRD